MQMLHRNALLVLLLWFAPQLQVLAAVATSNPCTSVASITSILKSHSNSAFCSSILPITTKTVTSTTTSTVKSTVAITTVTATASSKAPPLTVVKTLSTTVTQITKTATAPAQTKTVTITVGLQAREFNAENDLLVYGRAAAAVSTPTYLTKYASKSLSLACSCLHLSTPTVTSFKTSKVTSKVTRTVKATKTITLVSTTTVTSRVTISRTATTTLTPITTKTVTYTATSSSTAPCLPGQVLIPAYSPWQEVYDGSLFPGDGAIPCGDRTSGYFNLGVQTTYDYMLDYCKQQVEQSGGLWSSYYVTESHYYQAQYDSWLVEDVECFTYTCELKGSMFSWDIDAQNSCGSTCSGSYQVSQNIAYS
ncbi:hypothetical protein ABW20_dc0101785 [Dactylellina cionopaga]|nr:hypothetical protein ABW20_dc0101785 [Dactylellina cionopaga]